MNDRDDRPKTIGEILDRAVSAYVGAFVPLFAIVAVAVIPTVIAQYALLPGMMHAFDQITVPGPGGATAAENARILRQLSSSNTVGGFAFVGLLALFLYALAETALVRFATARLDGAPVSIAEALRTSVPRWLAQVVVSLAFLAFALIAYVGLVLVVFVGALATYGAYALAPAAGIVVGVVLGMAAFAVAVAAFSLVYIAWQMTAVVVAVEDAHAVRAIGRGLRRAFDRTLLRRSLLVAVAIAAVDVIGGFVFLAFGALAGALAHLALLTAVVSSIGGIVLFGLRSLFVLVYTRDVRLRREGADLLELAGEAPAPA